MLITKRSEESKVGVGAHAVWKIKKIIQDFPIHSFGCIFLTSPTLYLPPPFENHEVVGYSFITNEIVTTLCQQTGSDLAKAYTAR